MDKTTQHMIRVKSIERGLYLTIFALLTIIQIFLFDKINIISKIPYLEFFSMFISAAIIYLFLRIKVTMESLDDLTAYRLRLFVKVGLQPCEKKDYINNQYSK